MRDQAVDRQPPKAVLRMVNPVLRTLLRSPVGRALPALAVLEFSGRHSGRRYRVVTGWYSADGQELAVTPAGWRLNFVDGAPLTVIHRGRSRLGSAVLDADPAAVAEALRQLLSSGTSARALGMGVPEGYEIGPHEVLGKALIRFTPA